MNGTSIIAQISMSLRMELKLTSFSSMLSGIPLSNIVLVGTSVIHFSPALSSGPLSHLSLRSRFLKLCKRNKDHYVTEQSIIVNS